MQSVTGRPAALARAWHYLRSCGLLLLPVIAWNLAFAPLLPLAFAPERFWRDIPTPLAFAENGLRVAVFALPFLMPLDRAARRRTAALTLFGAGSLLYFGAWLPLMLAPHSAWSHSPIGFTAPALTPLVWLAGIGLLGRRLYWPSPYRRWHYLVLSAAFVAVHFAHALLVFQRSASSG